ncbi:MAG: DUF6883 domain-containing protein [Caulobacterales bacterium]
MVPGAEAAFVSPEKARYLLDADHLGNGGKAGFFTAFGFQLSLPEALASALLATARASVHATIRVHFGVHYVVIAPIDAPDGRRLWVKAVWRVDDAGGPPRLVTAYPESPAR